MNMRIFSKLMKEADNSDQDLTAAPVLQAERIRSLDVLRGFALLGVLCMNMQAFADVFAVYVNPFAVGEISAVDYACWCVLRVVADAKFMTIFSMLFGAGIVLIADHAKAKSGKPARIHYRRMLWLALFGAAHAILLWNGDILFFYAVVGIIAYPLRRFWPWLQGLLVLLFFGIPAFFTSQFANMPTEDLAVMMEMWSPTAEYVESKRAIIRGGYFGQIADRYEEWTGMLMFLLFFGWRILACMLLGMMLFRKGIFSAIRSLSFYLTMIIVGFGVGLPLAALGILDHQACRWEMVRSMGVGSLFNYFGSIFAAFGWIGLVMLVCKTGALPELQVRLAAVGQMAFTNYIMHSLVCSIIYNGHGLGLFGSIDRIWQQPITLAIFALQLWYSPLWLKRYRFGPLEWIWRALTYWHQPPFRRVTP